MSRDSADWLMESTSYTYCCESWSYELKKRGCRLGGSVTKNADSISSLHLQYVEEPHNIAAIVPTTPGYYCD